MSGTCEHCGKKLCDICGCCNCEKCHPPLFCVHRIKRPEGRSRELLIQDVILQITTTERHLRTYRGSFDVWCGNPTKQNLEIMEADWKTYNDSAKRIYEYQKSMTLKQQ